MDAQQPRLYLPRHWPSWIGLAIGWMISKLPYPLQMAIGRRIGDLTYRLMESRRAIVRINIGLAFPDLSETEREAMVRSNFRSTGMGVVEALICWWGSEKAIQRLVSIEGMEHLDKVRAHGGGVLLLSAHFTSLEMGARVDLGLENPTAMYRPVKNPVVDKVMRARREKQVGSNVLTKDDVRGLIKVLRRGGAVWYAPDQSANNKFSAEVPFFGVPAMTNLATSRLAKMGKAQVVPFFTLRREDGKGYRAIILPALDNFPSEDEVADALRINQLIESVVMQAPAQYFWMHRRFKRKDDKDPYR